MLIIHRHLVGNPPGESRCGADEIPDDRRRIRPQRMLDVQSFFLHIRNILGYHLTKFCHTFGAKIMKTGEITKNFAENFGRLKTLYYLCTAFRGSMVPAEMLNAPFRDAEGWRDSSVG